MGVRRQKQRGAPWTSCRFDCRESGGLLAVEFSPPLLAEEVGDFPLFVGYQRRTSCWQSGWALKPTCTHSQGEVLIFLSHKPHHLLIHSIHSFYAVTTTHGVTRRVAPATLF